MRRIASGLALAAAMIGPAWASKDTAALDYALAGEPDSLDPHWAYDAQSFLAIDAVYETLIGFAGSSLDSFEPRVATVVPSLANGFLSRDGLTYAFPLLRGARFHDGSPLTPEDVKYSLMRFLLLDREGGPSHLLIQPVLGLRSLTELPPDQVFDLADKAVSIEGGALVLRLRRPFAPMLSVLAGFAHVVSKSFTAAHGGWDGRRETWLKHRDPAKEASALYARANGTGPFRLESWDRTAKTVALARFDGYWRRPAALERVVLSAVQDPRERRRRLASGEADAAYVDRLDAAQFENLPGVVVTDGLPALEAQNTVLFNLAVETAENQWIGAGALGDGVPPDFFADAEARKAFALAFDGEAFIREAYRGKAVPARGPVPAVVFGHNPRQKPWPYSLEQSAAAFKRARNGEIWDKGFALSVAYTEGRADRRVACRLLKEGVEKVSPKFRVECRAMPESRLLDELRARRLPCLVYHWVMDYPDAHNAVEPFLHSRGYFASALGYSNPRADAMIEQAAAEIDPAKRKALYYELQAMSIYDAPAIFTADSYNLTALGAKVKGWLYHPIQPYGDLYEVTKLP